MSTFAQLQEIEDEFSSEQLAGIGGVVVAYNRAEHAVDSLLPLGLGLSPEFASMISPFIGPIENKIETVKLTAEALDLSKEAQKLLSESFMGELGFITLKRYRDTIARIGAPISRTPGRTCRARSN